MDSYGNPTTEKLTVSDYNPIKFNFPFKPLYLPFKYKISIHNILRASRELLLFLGASYLACGKRLFYQIFEWDIEKIT